MPVWFEGSGFRPNPLEKVFFPGFGLCPVKVFTGHVGLQTHVHMSFLFFFFLWLTFMKTPSHRFFYIYTYNRISQYIIGSGRLGFYFDHALFHVIWHANSIKAKTT